MKPRKPSLNERIVAWERRRELRRRAQGKQLSARAQARRYRRGDERGRL